MGFSIYYRSTEPIDADRANAIRASANDLSRGRTWLSCEPVSFFTTEDDGRLFGGSKPSFEPHPDDVASAESEGLPDGTLRDLLDALCQISQKHRVDWEFSHDHEPGPIGFIRDGIADAGLMNQIDALADVGDTTADIMGEFGSDIDGFGMTEDSSDPSDASNGDDDSPPTLKLWSE